MSQVLIIAETGSCHGGDLQKMFGLIAAAKVAGADVCKFQWTSDPDRMAARRGRAIADGYHAIYRRYLAWPQAWHADLRAECERLAIDYMCSVYLPDDIVIVEPYVTRFKIASFEACDAAFITAHRAFRKPIIVSVGMMTSDQVMGVIRLLGEAAAVRYLSRRRPIEASRDAVLHCISAYPAPVDELNLRAISMCEHPDGLEVGFSDHSAPELVWTGAMAVAAGATIVEAHLKLTETAPDNPDAPHAMTGQQFSAYTNHIRFAEICCGDGLKKLERCERPLLRYRVEPSKGYD